MPVHRWSSILSPNPGCSRGDLQKCLASVLVHACVLQHILASMLVHFAMKPNEFFDAGNQSGGAQAEDQQSHFKILTLTLRRMKSWLEASKIKFSLGQNRTLFQHFDQFGLWGSLGGSGDQSVSLGRLWGARMVQDDAKMVKDGAKPTVRPTDRPSDRPSLRPTVRPPDRLYTLTPDQPALLARY